MLIAYSLHSKYYSVNTILYIFLQLETFKLLFRHTPITPLIGVERTSKASQSGTYLAESDFNMGAARLQFRHQLADV